ncbi:MAG TPA: YhfC family glutamic-type intramembrane protease [bacterium]|nr:YhfC family glutamic-type intramembrane protease [bacterium]
MNVSILIAFILGGLFILAFPAVGALIVWRKTGAKWLYFLIGMATFMLFQVILRIPAISVIQYFFADWLQSSALISWTWLVLLCLTAGIFEEGGRYLALRFVLKPPHAWKNGLMFGLGHGGFEAWLIGLGAIIGNIVIMFMPAEMLQGPTLAAKEEIMNLPLLMTAVSPLERLMATVCHIGFTLIVLRAFRHGASAWGWLTLAVIAHAIVNLVAVIVMKLAGVWLAEAALALIVAWVIVWIVYEYKNENGASTNV